MVKVDAKKKQFLPNVDLVMKNVIDRSRSRLFFSFSKIQSSLVLSLSLSPRYNPGHH